MFDKDFCRSVHIASPGIIPQTFPGLEDLLQVRICQLFDMRKEKQKFLIIRQNSLYLSLLKHHFRNPYPVRIIGFSPWKPAVMATIPLNKPFSKLFDLFGCHNV